MTSGVVILELTVTQNSIMVKATTHPMMFNTLMTAPPVFTEILPPHEM